MRGPISYRIRCLKVCLVAIAQRRQKNLAYAQQERWHRGRILNSAEEFDECGSVPPSSSKRLGKRSSNTRFRKACAFSALCQMKRARPVLISRGAIAGIHAAMLTRRERSQKKKRLSSWAVSNR